MSELPRTPAGTEAPGSQPGPVTEASGPDRRTAPPTLRLTVVEYERGPNRATIHPRGLTGIERMETWLSANADAFVDLSACR